LAQYLCKTPAGLKGASKARIWYDCQEMPY
jgi:hypothetical protein